MNNKQREEYESTEREREEEMYAHDIAPTYEIRAFEAHLAEEEGGDDVRFSQEKHIANDSWSC